MDPPTYDEARLHPPVSGRPADNVSPPPSYHASLSSPPTPPPTYGEAVTQAPNLFPILTPPQATVTSSSHTTVHPTTWIGVTPAPLSSRTQAAVVTSQPRSGHSSSVRYLRDVPDVVRCPHCHNTVTTKVDYIPGKAAWCLCLLLAVMGLICGCCFIPFMVRGLHDAHHSCPECGKMIYIYTR